MDGYTTRTEDRETNIHTSIVPTELVNKQDNFAVTQNIKTICKNIIQNEAKHLSTILPPVQKGILSIFV